MTRHVRRGKQRHLRQTIRKPLIPTTVVTSFKGGVGKTAFAVSSAERLAHAGLRVLLICTDPQMDAPFRLGLKAQEQTVNTYMPVLKDLPNGGSLDVISCHPDRLTKLLYNTPAITGTYDAAIVDTAPEARVGKLPYVRFWIPVDGKGAGRTARVLMSQRSKTSPAVIIPVKGFPVSLTVKLSKALGIKHWPQTVNDSQKVKDAHDDNVSTWTLSPRSGWLKEHLAVADEIALELWDEVREEDYPPPPKASGFIEYDPYED